MGLKNKIIVMIARLHIIKNHIVFKDDKNHYITLFNIF